MNGQADLYVADRKTGAPVEKADVALWADGKLQSSGKTDGDGMASLTMTVRGGAQGAEPENVWILARHGADAALVTPWGYGFGAQNQQHGRGLYLHGPAGLPAGTYRAHQGDCAQGRRTTRCSCRKDGRRRCR